jgi:hypothetical protein
MQMIATVREDRKGVRNRIRVDGVQEAGAYRMMLDGRSAPPCS